MAPRSKATYGKGKYCPTRTRQDVPGHRRHHARSWRQPRPDKRAAATSGAAGTPSRRPMRKDFTRYVELAEQRRRELGFADNGAMWRVEVRHAARRFRARSSTGCGSRCGRSTLAARLRAREAAREIRRRGAGKRPDSGRTCWATSGRRTGTTSTRWWRRPGADPGYDPDRRS